MRFAKGSVPGRRLACRVNPAQIRQSGEIDAFDISAVRDQDCRAGIIELISNFALAECGIEQSGNGSGELGGMESYAEFPGIREENGDNLTGLDAGRDQAMRQDFRLFLRIPRRSHGGRKRYR